MRESMLGRIVTLVVTVPAVWLGTLVDLLEKILSKEAGQDWFAALRRFLRKENAWDGKKPLLRFLSTIKVVGSKRFVVKDAFQVNTDPSQRVRISYLGENFKRRFWPKIEENVEDTTLRVHELLEMSRDIPVVAELGNEEGVEIFLVHFYEVLAAKQAAGDYSWIIGYARDEDGDLCPVGADWDDVGGWRVDADSLGSPGRWTRSRRFLSRNS